MGIRKICRSFFYIRGVVYLNIIKLKINEIKPYKNNAKIHTTEQIEQIKKSIEEFGMNDPIAVWGKDNIIVEGHGRLEALKQLGYTEIDCIRLDHLSDEERKAYTLAHNKLTMNTDFDFDILDSELADIADIDMSDFGFDLSFEDEEKEVEDDDFNIDENIPEEPKAKYGDIYKLGEHRLMCGDSTKQEDVKKLMQGSKADTIFTDPPYDFTECNYNKSIEDSIENANVFIMNDDVNMVKYLRKSNLKFKNFFIANFGFASPRGNEPYLQHILISHETKGNANKNLNLKDGFRSIIKMEYRGRLKEEKTEHKHQKSLKFIADFLVHYASELVLDLFGGSGSTLMACEQLNKVCYMMELEPKYVDLIIKRWEDYTGKKVIKIKEQNDVK